MDSTMSQVIVSETPTLQFVVSEADAMKNAPEFAAQEASFVANATLPSTTEYSTERTVCQYFLTPSFDEIENEIKTAARGRIEAALRNLNETRARIEREANARELAIQATQERVKKTQGELDGLASERAEMECRAQTFLTDDALKATLEKIHLAFNVRQIELEDALAQAQADVEELQTEIQAVTISDGLELQFAEQDLARLAAAAPDVAQFVRLAATAQENLAAALQAAQEGLLHDAQALLDKAKAGDADAKRVTEVEQAIEEAHHARTACDLIARIEAHADQIGAVRRIKKLMDQAESAGVADRVRDSAERSLDIARQAANTRYAQARPIADHLASEGFVPVVGDGRIEVWQAVTNNSRGHGTSWTLDRVIELRGAEWKVESPRMPVTRKELPERVQHSRWYKRPSRNVASTAN